MAGREDGDLQRRVTKISGDSLRPLRLVNGVLKDDTGKALPKTQQKRPLPISDNKLSFDPRQDNPIKKYKCTEKLSSSKPAVTYSEFLRLDQAGPAIIASENTKSCSLVAVKSVKIQKGQPLPVQAARDEGIVNLLDAYRKSEDEMIIIYELMSVSLRLVNSVARGKWNVYEIAAVCKEVINGLSFIHRTLGLYHGNLDCSTILLDSNGRAKVANIGDSMLEQRQLDEPHAQNDIKSIGYMMIELMEEGTFHLEPGSVQLKNPDVWQPDLIKRFLAATQTSTLAELSRHDFLPGESLCPILKPYVFTALICAKTDWAMLSSGSD